MMRGGAGRLMFGWGWRGITWNWFAPVVLNTGGLPPLAASNVDMVDDLDSEDKTMAASLSVDSAGEVDDVDGVPPLPTVNVKRGGAVFMAMYCWMACCVCSAVTRYPQPSIADQSTFAATVPYAWLCLVSNEVTRHALSLVW
jgi:hypothetical protein